MSGNDYGVKQSSAGGSVSSLSRASFRRTQSLQAGLSTSLERGNEEQHGMAWTGQGLQAKSAINQGSLLKPGATAMRPQDG
jgi:hypothetical protein